VDFDTVVSDFGQGDVMIASKALAAGLIDEVGTFNGTLATLGAATNKSSSRSAARAQERSMAKNVIPGATAPGVDQADDESMKCAKCEEPIHPDATVYCKGCFDQEPDGDEKDDEDEDEEDAKAMKGAGLLGTKRAETRANLVAFAKSVLKETGCATAAEAQGAVKANAEANAELATVRATTAATAKAQAKQMLVGAIGAAISGGKITLADAEGLVDFLPDAEAAKVRVELDKPETQQTSQALLGAFAMAEPDDRAVKAITSYLAKKGAAFPTAHREPPLDEQHTAAIAVDAPTAKRFGLDPKRAAELLNVNCVSDLPSAKKKGA
jgi:hypothetical protein